MHPTTILALAPFLAGLVSTSPLAANVPLSISPDDAAYDPPTAEEKKNVKCNIPGFKATNQWPFTNPIQNDGTYEYFKGLSGKTNIKAKDCDRVSCGYGLAVSLCNDNDSPLQIDWMDVQTYANDVALTCGHGRHIKQSGQQYWALTDDYKGNGQKFSDGGWNVIVYGADC